jgi:hypothetical protein
MRTLLLFAAVLVIGCGHGNDPATGGAGTASSGPSTMPAPPPPNGSAAQKPATDGSADQVATKDPDPAAKPAPPPTSPTPPPAPAPGPLEGHQFTPEAKTLMAIGACGDAPVPDGFAKKLVEDHCKDIQKTQDSYLEKWVKPAKDFFASHVPKDLPKKVVYPFAGGDLSTALTVFPDADEITTMSLEPAGDPRDVDTVKGKELEAALKKVRYELNFLYRVNFSNTINMIDAMRGGHLPTQLIFGLSAVKIHGYELVSLRYFSLNDDGGIHYLDDADIAKAPDAKTATPERRNRVFANIELQFRRPGGRVQVYRHIQTNLDNEHTKADPRVLRHLEAKGPVSGMTKAASYLLSWDSFSNIRDYLTKNVVWMVSDATGIAPKWGKPAGFEYETYGQFVGSHIGAGNAISPNWRTEFDSEPKRDLAFRFGYYDKHSANHLVIIKKKKT